jgi:hypothetical protein
VVPSAPQLEQPGSVYGVPPAMQGPAKPEEEEHFYEGLLLAPAGAPQAATGFLPYSRTWATMDRGLEPGGHRGFLFVGVSQARNLPALNRDHATSDPYVRVCVIFGDGEKSKPLESVHVIACFSRRVSTPSARLTVSSAFGPRTTTSSSRHGKSLSTLHARGACRISS